MNKIQTLRFVIQMLDQLPKSETHADVVYGGNTYSLPSTTDPDIKKTQKKTDYKLHAQKMVEYLTRIEAIVMQSIRVDHLSVRSSLKLHFENNSSSAHHFIWTTFGSGVSTYIGDYSAVQSQPELVNQWNSLVASYETDITAIQAIVDDTNTPLIDIMALL